MSFLYPEALWLLFFIFSTFFLKRRVLRSKETWSLLAALIFLVIAFARPYEKQQDTKEISYGLDAVIAIDVSHSMSADDRKPNRFEASKEMVKKLIAAESLNRYAIMAFTSNALPLSPLTNDREILSMIIESIEIKNIITKSTDLLKVLEKSAQILKTEKKTVIILSDGGDKREFSQEIAFAKKNGIKILFIPVGTSYGSKLYDEYGELIRDDAKRMVISALNPHIKKAVLATGGKYYESFDAKKIAQELKDTPQEYLKTVAERKNNREYFIVFLLLAFLFFLFGTTQIKAFNRVVVLIAFISLQSDVDAGPMEVWYEYRAKNSYEKKEFERAALYYEKLAATNESYKTAYNLANCYYQLGKFEQAVILYEAVKSDNSDFKSDVYYNLANAYAKKEEFEKADKSYLKSLILKYHSDADKNRKAVKKAKKGYKPDSMQKKGGGEKDKSSQPQSKKNQKEPKGEKESQTNSKKINLSKEEESMIKQARSKKSLSYKQYQQINERAKSDEKNPW